MPELMLQGPAFQSSTRTTAQGPGHSTCPSYIDASDLSMQSRRAVQLEHVAFVIWLKHDEAQLINAN